MLFRQPQQDPSTAFDPWPYTGWQPPRRSTLGPKSFRGQQCAEAPLGPGGATKQLHGSARAISRWKVASPPSLHGLRGTAGAVHRNTVWASQRGRSAWWPRRSGCRPCLRHPVGVLGQRPASSVRCERPVSTRAYPGMPVQATGVQCPVRASERPGVRCPVSGVRAFPRPLCPAEVRSCSAAVGQAAARLGWPGSAWSPAASTTGSWSARVGAWRSKLARAVLGQQRCRFGLGRRRGRWLGSGQGDRVADSTHPRARIVRR
jgi:hypothetical protein